MVTFVRDGEEEGGDDDAASTTSNATVTPGTMVGLADAVKTMGTPGTWSKANLRPNERVGWTRGRDGWCGVGGEIRCIHLTYVFEVLAFAVGRNAHLFCTAATSLSPCRLVGRSSKPKAGDPI